MSLRISRAISAQTSVRELQKTQTSKRQVCSFAHDTNVDVVHCITLSQQHSGRKVGIIELCVESCPMLVSIADRHKYYYDNVHALA